MPHELVIFSRPADLPEPSWHEGLASLHEQQSKASVRPVLHVSRQGSGRRQPSSNVVGGPICSRIDIRFERRWRSDPGWTLSVSTRTGISGAKGRDKRPRLDSMMRAVIAKRFDMVGAWSVDRLGRSLTDLLGILQDLQEKGSASHSNPHNMNRCAPYWWHDAVSDLAHLKHRSSPLHPSCLRLP
jgi:hypothetical protein